MTHGDAVEHELTHRDLDGLPDDGNRYELIDGELYVSAFPTYAHQNVTTALTSVLYDHVTRNGLGKVLAAGLKVVLDEPTAVGPDVVYVAAGRMDGMREDGFYGAPDLLVEVVSSKPQLDRYIKLNRYARAGVPHCWIVDPVKRRLSAYRLEGTRYRLVAEPGGDDVFEPELLPGLRIDLSDLWVR